MAPAPGKGCREGHGQAILAQATERLRSAVLPEVYAAGIGVKSRNPGCAVRQGRRRAGGCSSRYQANEGSPEAQACVKLTKAIIDGQGFRPQENSRTRRYYFPRGSVPGPVTARHAVASLRTRCPRNNEERLVIRYGDGIILSRKGCFCGHKD